MADMTPLTDILNDAAATAVPVQNNFQTIESYINGTELLRADGTKVMTGDLDADSNSIVNLVDPVSAQDAATKAYVDTAAAAAGVGLYPKLVGFKDAGPDSGTATPPATVWYTDAAITYTFDASHVYVFEFSGVQVTFANNSSANNRRTLAWVRDIGLSGNTSTLAQIEFNSDANGPTVKKVNWDVKKRDTLSLSGPQTIRPGIVLSQTGSEALTDSITSIGGYFAIYDMGPYTT